MNRITQKDLEYLCKKINETTNSPLHAYTKQTDGSYKTNVGNYHLSYAYGGVKLERMCSEGGGVNSISTTGFGTKRELYNWMCAYLQGLTTKN